MLNKKEKYLEPVVELKQLNEKPKIRLVVKRGEERRASDVSYTGVEKRNYIRRGEDIIAQQIESEVNVNSTELALYYMALFIGINVIFGWMAYFVLYA